MVSERKEGGRSFDELRHADMEQDRSILDAPVAPLPNPGRRRPRPTPGGRRPGSGLIPWPIPTTTATFPSRPCRAPGEGGPRFPRQRYPAAARSAPAHDYIRRRSLSKRGLRLSRLPRLCGQPSGGRPVEFRVALGLHAPSRGLPNRDRHRHGRLYLHPEDHSV